MSKVLVNYIGKSGGGPAFAFEFAKGLANNGFDVYVVVSEYVDNKIDWEKCDLFKDVYFVKTNRLRGKQYYLKAQLEFMFWGKYKLKRYFKKIKFDYVITTMQHLWSLDISKVVNTKKIVWICHDPIPHSGSKKIDEYLGNSFAKIADETVVLTKSFISIINDRWGISKDQIHFMPHGRQNMYETKEINKRKYSDGKINFLFFGYLRDYKGISILAKAFKRVNEIYDNVTLTVAGSGNFEKYKEDFACLTNITIENRYISDDEVTDFFCGPNIVTVMPYLDATQSGVSLIAMEFGSVVIASDTGGLKEQLDEGNIGLYCQPGDVDSLIDRMVYVVENQEAIFSSERQKMERYLSTLEWNAVTKKLMEEI